jgi:hypothetical protein
MTKCMLHIAVGLGSYLSVYCHNISQDVMSCLTDVYSFSAIREREERRRLPVLVEKSVNIGLPSMERERERKGKKCEFESLSRKAQQK